MTANMVPDARIINNHSRRARLNIIIYMDIFFLSRLFLKILYLYIMSDNTRSGKQQMTDARIKEGKDNEFIKNVEKYEASPFGKQEERYNENDKKPKLKKEVDEGVKELTEKQADRLDMAEDMEQAHLNLNAQEISGLRIFQPEDKKEAMRLYNSDKKYISMSSMGQSINAGQGLFSGGYRRMDFINGRLGGKVNL